MKIIFSTSFSKYAKSLSAMNTRGYYFSRKRVNPISSFCKKKYIYDEPSGDEGVYFYGRYMREAFCNAWRGQITSSLYGNFI